MNRVFIISDTHFNHSNILKYESEHRPFATIEEHDAELISRWNAAVKPKDTVWHLGDVLFGSDSFHLLRHLNGIKNLILGNHDHYPMEKYAEHFNKILGCAQLHGCILTHIPVAESQFGRFKANIHGHMHSKTLEDKRYYNVSCERLNLTPRLLSSVVAEIDRILAPKKDGGESK